MSSSIESLPDNNNPNDNIDDDVDQILTNLQKEYNESLEDSNQVENEEFIDNSNYINNNINQQFNNLSIDDEKLQKESEPDIINTILKNIKEPLLVLIIVILINNNFTFSFLKDIPQLATENGLNIIGYGAIAILIAITFCILNIISSQYL